MCEVEVIAKSIDEAREATGGNHGPNADQNSIIKQHAVEVLEHTHTSSYIINIQVVYIVGLNEWIPTLQK